MSKEVSRKPYRIYDKGTRQWFEVTPEQYAEFDQWRTNKRKREQYHGRCMCPRNKWWLCDGLCDDCEFHAPGDMLSLDKPVSFFGQARQQRRWRRGHSSRHTGCPGSFH